jgi:ribose 5-phosphate isomerase A
MNRDDAKRLAAQAALDLLPPEGVIGLGSGSTAQIFIDGVGALVKAGRNLKGVPTSEASRAQAERLGIELLPDAGPWSIDVCVDGADEVSEALDLIKGGGGCHTREKIVNHAARTNVIVVDDSKLSARLGEKWAVPVEILPFGGGSTVRALSAFGTVTQRLKNGAPWITDAGNPIFDVRAGVIADPGDLDRRLRAIPGVVDTGLFVKRADVVLVAGEAGVKRLDRSGARGG